MRVAIVGAGIAGLTLAMSLRRSGHEPVVIEKAPRLREGGYMIDFVGPGYEAAAELDLLGDLARIHRQIDRLAFLDARGREKYSLRYTALRRRLFRDRHFNFMRGDLERILYERIAQDVDFRFGVTVSSFEDDGRSAHVVLSDQGQLDADLLVGADGIHSHLRRLAFGPEEQFVVPLGYRVAAFVIDHPIDRIPGDTFSTITGWGCQVSVYPIPGDRVATLFVHRAPTAAGPREGPREELCEVYRELGWIVPSLLRAIPDPPALYFDDVAQVEVPRWSSGRVVLLGDACQAVSLLGGQGASLALAGACVLARELNATPDVRAALAAYERRVRPAVERKQAAGRRFAKWFVPEDRFHLLVRDAAMRLSAWPVASGLVRHSIDVSGFEAE
jgi:2-polyprenyl-6-methoxyphenol hydroxylase-like FAD-dependent oxidoreductase